MLMKLIPLRQTHWMLRLTHWLRLLPPDCLQSLYAQH
jgi:hypothetical protein